MAYSANNRNRYNIPIDSSPTPSVITHHEPWHASFVDVGIFRDTLYPSFALHGSLAIGAYLAGRAADRVDAKDVLWPIAPVINSWWSAVGRKVFVRGLPLAQALGALSRPERLILTGVTLWGGRLFYRTFTRANKRGKEDPRYDDAKTEDNFWNKALFTVFLPEALIQTLITLPFTAPFHHQGAVLSGYHPFMQAFAVGMFGTGFALEVAADRQLDKHKESALDETSLCKTGVWSIVRHPNYLGDALIHFSFPILLYASDMLAPIELLGPIANYAYLRFLGGDKATEHHQERRYSVASPDKAADLEAYREEKNSFWPRIEELGNEYLWIVLGAGSAVAIVEQLFHLYL